MLCFFAGKEEEEKNERGKINALNICKNLKEVITVKHYLFF